MTTVAASAPYDLESLRTTEFPWTAEKTYLDAASTGPLPERTLRVLADFNRRRSRPWDLHHEQMFGLFERSRSLVAKLINADPTEIALATNTTYGIAVAARALPLEQGEVVVVSAREFPANVYPWMRLADRGARFELVPVTEQGWPDEEKLLQRMEDPKVRVMAVSLTQFASGYTIDLARFSETARRTNTWLVVDAIQGVGQLPLDLQRTPVDILSCGAQKWLLSPWGSGFMYVRKELIGRLDPEMVSWMSFQGTDDFSRLTDYNPALRDDARRFEMVTLPFQDFAGMNSSVELLLELGIEKIAQHLRALHQPVLEWAERRGVRITSPVGAHGSGIICLAPKDPGAAHKALRAAGVLCSLREGSLRLAPHCYTAPSDFARVMEVLEQQ
ncbi:MAG TPA: aminotransferase class V-fold PLP-dependent enzyme [Gemmatimonadales bacterium]|nr:aminotransferase class V-fold PLP-dependent enzyme [Gemmatimonadales bacterium]